MKKIKKIIIILIIMICLAGCTSAETVSHNISRESDEFKIKRYMNEIDREVTLEEVKATNAGCR